MYTTVIILIVLLSISLYVNYNLLRRTKHQEDLLESREEYLVSLHIQLLHATDRIVELDSKGVFRAEDEVGTFFDELVLVAKSIESIIGGLSDQ